MTTDVTSILVLILLACFLVALCLRRLCRYLVDLDTRRRVHAAVKRMTAVDQLKRYGREDRLDEQSAEFLKRWRQ